jgi:hypothetical protein
MRGILPDVPERAVLAEGKHFEASIAVEGEGRVAGERTAEREPRRVALVKLSPLSNGRARHRRNRIGMDDPRERLATA